MLKEWLKTPGVQGILVLAFIYVSNVLYIKFLHDKYPNSTVTRFFSIGGGSGSSKGKSKSSSSHSRSKGGSF